MEKKAGIQVMSLKVLEFMTKEQMINGMLITKDEEMDK